MFLYTKTNLDKFKKKNPGVFSDSLQIYVHDKKNHKALIKKRSTFD